jgi:hypothetical protein
MLPLMETLSGNEGFALEGITRQLKWLNDNGSDRCALEQRFQRGSLPARVIEGSFPIQSISFQPKAQFQRVAVMPRFAIRNIFLFS